MPFGGEVRAGGTGDLTIRATGAGDNCCMHDAVELAGGSTLTAVSGDVRLELERGPSSVGLAAKNSWEAGSEMGTLFLSDETLFLDGATFLGNVQFEANAELQVRLDGGTINSLGIANSIDLTGLRLDITGSAAPQPDTTLTLIDNRGASPILGAFNALPAGGAVDIKGVRLMIIYNGGDGNDAQLVEFEAAYGISAFTKRFYTVVLSRDPDPAGLDGWVAGLTGGTLSGSDLARGFFLSPEYTNKVKSASAFLDDCYQAYFNRSADAGGKQGWLDLLVQGMSRSQVLDGFSGSQEFIALAESYGIRPFAGYGSARVAREADGIPIPVFPIPLFMLLSLIHI